jgi:hypothetical protein
VAIVNQIDILSLNSRIIDGSTSQTDDQLYFVGTGKNYVKKSDSGSYLTINASGNFAPSSNPVGKNFFDILDGGNSSKDNSQFIAPVVGGVFPVEKTGI